MTTPGRLQFRAGHPRGLARRRRVVQSLTAALTVGAASVAHANPPPTQPVRLAASTESHISTETSEVLPAWTPAVTLVNRYGQLTGASPAPNSWSLQRRASSHLLVAFGLFDWVELDLGVPMVIYQEGTTANTTLESTLRSTGIGDIRTGMKGTILKTPARGFGLGVSFDVTFPTGTREALLGEAGPTYAPQLLMEYRFAWGIETAVNLGYYIREDVTVGNVTLADSLTIRGAARLPFGARMQAAAEQSSSTDEQSSNAPSPTRRGLTSPSRIQSLGLSSMPQTNSREGCADEDEAADAWMHLVSVQFPRRH